MRGLLGSVPGGPRSFPSWRPGRPVARPEARPMRRRPEGRGEKRRPAGRLVVGGRWWSAGRCCGLHGPGLAPRAPRPAASSRWCASPPRRLDGLGLGPAGPARPARPARRPPRRPRRAARATRRATRAPRAASTPPTPHTPSEKGPSAGRPMLLSSNICSQHPYTPLLKGTPIAVSYSYDAQEAL